MKTDDRRMWAWQAQSLLIGYPDEELSTRFDLLRSVAQHLDPVVGTPLITFLDHASRTPLTKLAEDYVATFDHRRRCCLFLTYYAHGDTRRRGMALLEMKQAYSAAGYRLTAEELPDHLSVVLEFAATDPERGLQLLSGHRSGLELLRLALHDAHSPWAAVLDSVSATLPPARDDERMAAARLAAAGPPAEKVGLTPYGGASR